MILQQLQKDADHLVGTLPPPSYDLKAVKWIVQLDGAGRCQGIGSTSGGEGKRDRGKQRLVPFQNRTSAVTPLLLVDKPAYTWGLPADDSSAPLKHRAYVDLLERCARETGNPDVVVVLDFVRNWRDRLIPSEPEALPDELTTFSVDGRFPIDATDVRAFWARLTSGAEDAGVAGQCLICGAKTRLVERLPVTVQGIPDGHSAGVALVSANATAFESYGRKAALTSPTCRECGERFGKAARALLSSKNTRYPVGPVAFVFWSPQSEWNPLDLFQSPHPEEVKLLLQSAREGRSRSLDADASFYATSVSAAISRAVFRGWLHTTVGEAQVRLARWFALQELVDSQGQPGGPLSIFRLAVSVYRDQQDIVARVPETLVRIALNGGALPKWLLFQAIQRNRADQGVTYPRATLIKMVLCSQQSEDPQRMAQLDLTNRDPAYLCGRLLAELEAVQRVAINPKATLVDRYYGSASSAPAAVFGVLLRAAQPHLAVLRKNRPGAFKALQERLEEIMSGLTSWPRTLTLTDQALFALGYYHQRAEDRRAAREAKERKLSAADAPTELADETEEN